MSIWSEKGLFPQSKTQNFHLLVCQRHDFLAQPGVVVIMCFFHCPGSNGTTTCYCRETDNVANTRFLGHFCTPTMLHLRAFVANQVLSPIRAYFGLFCPDFYSDIADFTQIFCRYLPKKLVAKTSDCRLWWLLELTLVKMLRTWPWWPAYLLLSTSRTVFVPYQHRCHLTRCEWRKSKISFSCLCTGAELLLKARSCLNSTCAFVCYKVIILSQSRP